MGLLYGLRGYAPVTAVLDSDPSARFIASYAKTSLDMRTRIAQQRLASPSLRAELGDPARRVRSYPVLVIGRERYAMEPALVVPTGLTAGGDQAFSAP